jgi:hypothetical protein
VTALPFTVARDTRVPLARSTAVLESPGVASRMFTVKVIALQS